MDELLSIGRFGRLTGLSVYALRHYDEVGLLTPAEVDASTAYRRYTRAQIDTARLIVHLRWLDLPLEAIRRVLADPDGDEARSVLREHRERLTREHAKLSRQLGAADQQLERGFTVPTVPLTSRPVQLKIAVDDLDVARRFYADAFGAVEQVVRHTEDQDFVAFQFGEYGADGFFLLHLLAAEGPDLDRPGPSTFGLLVGDLDQAHTRAVSVGATEVIAPHDAQGMPRSSAVRDSSGNCVWLYQG